MLKRLWMDEGGAILSAELILIMTILVIGMIVGLKVLQDAVVTELADVAAAIGSLNQSYAFAGKSATDPLSGTLKAFTAGSLFTDSPDSDDNPTPVSGTQQGVSVLVPPMHENDQVPTVGTQP